MANEAVEVPEKDKVVGAFASQLYRPNSQIKKDRADEILEDAQVVYKRRVEDMSMDIKRMKRDREKLLDINPGTKDSLKFPDFRAAEFADAHIKLTKDLHNLDKQLELMIGQYEYLFGEKLAL